MRSFLSGCKYGMHFNMGDEARVSRWLDTITASNASIDEERVGQMQMSRNTQYIPTKRPRLSFPTREILYQCSGKKSTTRMSKPAYNMEGGR